MSRALSLVPLLCLPAWSMAAAPTPLKAPITDVTVYADRAQVTRQGTAALSQAEATYVIGGLPGWIDPDSVRAELTPSAAGRIVDVSVQTRHLVSPSDPGLREAESAVLAVADALAAVGDDEQVLKTEIAMLESMRALSVEKLPADMVTRDVEVKTFAATVDYISKSVRQKRSELRALGQKRRELAPQLQAATKARDALKARAQLQERQVVVTVVGRGRGRLAVTYLTPGAAWEPVSELRTSTDGTGVKLVQMASVVQSTGEDWGDARLTLSTQRPAETLVIPEVTALLLGDDGVGLKQVQSRASSSFAEALTNYNSQSRIANFANADWGSTVSRQTKMQQRASAAFAKLATRGTTAHFQALVQRPVRSDGQPVRVPFARRDFTSTVRMVAVPEASLNVVRTAELENAGDLPILPGRASLFVDSAFVGTSELPFVAPGETFSTFLGVHDRVKLERTIDRRRSHIDRGRSRTTVKASFVITAENLDDAPVTLALGDRVPVAQNEDIELDDIRIPKGAKRSRDGVVTWTATIPARTTKTWRIAYEVEYPNDLVARAKASPAPARSQERMLYDQIESLEEAF